MAQAPIRRLSVRAIMIRPDERVLLIRYAEPDTEFQVWAMPGGGLKAGEERYAGLRREVTEETGHHLVAPGPLVWLRHHDFEWAGRPCALDEEYYLHRVEPFVPVMTHNPAEEEVQAFREFRWWSVAEIAGSDAVFAPHRLAQILGKLLREGPATPPVDVGV